MVVPDCERPHRFFRHSRWRRRFSKSRQIIFKTTSNFFVGIFACERHFCGNWRLRSGKYPIYFSMQIVLTMKVF